MKNQLKAHNVFSSKILYKQINNSISIRNRILYGYKKINKFLKFPIATKYNHTMYDSVNLFYEQKIPVNIIDHYIKLGYKIDIIGMYPLIFKKIFYRLGYKNVTEIPFLPNKRIKFYNSVRPQFYLGEADDGSKKVIVAVTPGRDYLKHYSSMIRNLLHLRYKVLVNSLRVFRYPNYEYSIASWTKLNNLFVKFDDIVVLGYVEEIEQNLFMDDQFTLISENYNEYYGSKRFLLPNGKIINLLGVKYSYWGDISKYLVTQILKLGASEIIYTAKLGSLTRREDIYSSIYSPSSYIILDYATITCGEFTIKNNFIKYFPELDSGLHCSVPTILEQTYEHRSILSTMNVKTIDNEISQMAKACYDFTDKTGLVRSFSAIHFATDYLRKKEEQCLPTSFDLSNNRTISAKKKKMENIKNISTYLMKYFLNT